jgi:hypothetical protein
MSLRKTGSSISHEDFKQTKCYIECCGVTIKLEIECSFKKNR